ncbi:hypothetical protein [Cellulosimicrobium marinum]|uniref:hypothetical protein n=1 Tax=Cellulosimicrobium marinum TaxID=1638992 RepID=UPI001E2EAF65|nr:hypothetical protein [Cellulosimicrobium marinum]MCB7136037.1 hypothetical protein [Cellulosimicrobium marinum]
MSRHAPTATAADLAAAVGQRLEQTPYRLVDPQPDGFTMVIDLADARWWGALSRSGLRETYAFVVRLEPDGPGYTILEQRRAVEWTVGAHGPQPRLGGVLSAHRFDGTTWTWTAKIRVGLDDEGRARAVVAYAFTPLHGRKIIREAAKSLGLRLRLNTQSKIGLVAAIFGGVVAVGGVVVAVVAATSGA